MVGSYLRRGFTCLCGPSHTFLPAVRREVQGTVVPDRSTLGKRQINVKFFSLCKLRRTVGF